MYNWQSPHTYKCHQRIIVICNELILRDESFSFPSTNFFAGTFFLFLYLPPPLLNKTRVWPKFQINDLFSIWEVLTLTSPSKDNRKTNLHLHAKVRLSLILSCMPLACNLIFLYNKNIAWYKMLVVTNKALVKNLFFSGCQSSNMSWFQVALQS